MGLRERKMRCPICNKKVALANTSCAEVEPIFGNNKEIPYMLKVKLVRVYYCNEHHVSIKDTIEENYFSAK